MNVTLLLAEIFAIYFIVTGIYMLLNRQHALSHINVMLEKEHVLWLISFFTVFLGSVLICIHNIWVLGWPVIITLLAWMTLAKGIGGIFAPASFKKTLFMYQNNVFYYVVSICMLALGLFLAIKAYLTIHI